MCVSSVYFLTDLGIALELQPSIIVYNAIHSYEYHEFLCSYNSSHPLQFRLAIDSAIGEPAASLYRADQYIDRPYPYGERLHAKLRLLPQHEAVKCLLYDNTGFEVARAVTQIRHNTYDMSERFPEPPGEGETAGALQQVVIDEPRIQVVAVGSTVTYYCRADNPSQDGRLYISWSRKNGELPYGRASDDRTGRLVITQVQTSDSGQYVCTISDGFNLVLQTEATLTVEDRRVPERPSVVIEDQRETVEVTVGQYYEVRCRADGYPTPRISWSRLDNLPLPPEASVQNGLLTFYDMTPASSGAYVCSGSNEGGQAQAIITIVVQGTLPELPYQPSTITVTVTQTEVEVSQGGTVRVDCSAPAQYAVTLLRWSRINGQLPQSASDYNGELVIPNAQPEDSGLYLCRIETSEGYSGEATSRIQILRTYNVPTVRIEPDRQTVNQGSTAEVRCIASGSPQPTISWSKVNSQFGRGVSVDGDVLRINVAEISDRGMYVCDARNSGGSARAVTVIEVERREPPSVKMYPEAQQSLQPGNTALFQCHLTGGIPMPEITWTRSDGRPMTPNTEIKPGGIITFNQVTGNEKGTYICTARNDAGEVRSTAVLDVVALPSISIQPSLSPYQVLEGSRVRLECSASGDPAPIVAWQLLRTNYPTDLAGRSLSPSTVEYEIQSIRPEEAGTYRCTATNSAGTAEEYIQVIVTPTLPGGPYPPVDRPRPPRPRPPPTTPATGSTQVSRLPVGSNYEFKCLVEDDSSVDFRDVETTFRRADDRPMPPTHRVQDGVLYLYDITREDGGEYACIGTDRLSGQILFTIYADVLVVEPPRISLEPERQVVQPGDTVSLLCKATGDQPITITWAKERSRMPPSVIINGGEMMFRGITPSDAGQYVCKAVNEAGTATAVAEVVVNEDPLITALRPSVRAAEGETVSLRCEVSGYDPAQVIWYRDGSSVLPLNALPRGNELKIRDVNVNNQGRYKCEILRSDYTRVSDYIDLTVDRRTSVDIRVEADPLNPRVGETVELTCSANEGSARVVKWGRSGGGDLPPNARQYGDRLQITNLRPSDGGIYTCTIMTASGAFTENYALVIQNLVSSDVVNYAPNARSVETRSAEFGSTVVMKCQAELEPPASFTWMKQDGQLPVQATVREATLEIPGVHAEDAGTYLCTARNDVRSVDLPIMLIVTGVIPRFIGNSYLGMPTLKDSYLRYDIELSFKPESPDGLILYNSRHDELTGDYVAFGLQDGYAVYQFDVGAGTLSLTSDAPLTIGEWHSVKLSRNRKNGRMSVDGSASVTGTTEGRHVGLELLTPLYVGGVPDGFTLNGQANYSRSFTGCVARLVVKDSIVELMRVAQDKVNIENCNTCGESPCNNGGICQESYAETGYKCLCSAGYQGTSCDETGDTCYPGLCANGRCVNRPGGYDCFCPFGKTGMHCEHDIIITEPAFADGSYIAYQTPSAIKRFSVGLKVKPTQEMKDGLLMYCAQNEQGDGDFTSLALRNKKLEFRFNTGTGTATLVSDNELAPGAWVKIHANRTDRMGSLRIDDGEMIHGESPGAHKGLNLRIPLYVGGVDTSKVEVASEVEVTDGFTGCISQINVNEREMSIADMSSSLVDSSNIGQCEGAADPYGACSQQDPCTNGGVCHDDLHESYRCVCPLGFTGRHCEQETPVEESASFSGQSWVEFGRELIMSDRNERSVTVEFTTSKPNGLLLWHGQGPTISGKGLDFFSIAIENGFAELKYRTRDGAGSVTSRVRVDDSVRHSLRATLGDQLATLQVDSLPVETASLPSNAPVNARGGVFIGGVPDVDLMTAGLYSVGFDGCLHGVVLGKTRVDTISESALSGVDVVACSRFRRTTRTQENMPWPFLPLSKSVSFSPNQTPVSYLPPSSSVAIASPLSSDPIVSFESSSSLVISPSMWLLLPGLFLCLIFSTSSVGGDRR
ncbi:Laminin G domain [Trinorchestia longiramus]|nr:Laminin G domain [Trinorchestia longiramus]